jgi:hypothetical protein
MLELMNLKCESELYSTFIGLIEQIIQKLKMQLDKY